MASFAAPATVCSQRDVLHVRLAIQAAPSMTRPRQAFEFAATPGVPHRRAPPEDSEHAGDPGGDDDEGRGGGEPTQTAEARLERAAGLIGAGGPGTATHAGQRRTGDGRTRARADHGRGRHRRRRPRPQPSPLRPTKGRHERQRAVAQVRRGLRRDDVAEHSEAARRRLNSAVHASQPARWPASAIASGVSPAISRSRPPGSTAASSSSSRACAWSITEPRRVRRRRSGRRSGPTWDPVRLPAAAERFPQSKQGAARPCLDGAQRPAQSRGDLRLRQVVLVGEQDHGPFGFGHAVERDPDREP